MLKRIWRGEIGLGWAFWVVGVFSFFPLFAVVFSDLPLPADWKAVPPVLALIFAYIFPTTVIWRSASRSSAKLWRRLAKSYVWLIILSPILGYSSLMILVTYLLGTAMMNPGIVENTTEMKDSAVAVFLELTDLEVPQGSKIAYVNYYSVGFTDFKESRHLILDATDSDLRKWIESARPFGSVLEQMTSKEATDENYRTESPSLLEILQCSDVDRPEGMFTGPICDLVKRPRQVWRADKVWRQMDRYDKSAPWREGASRAILTVLEEEKLIWLYLESVEYWEIELN